MPQEAADHRHRPLPQVGFGGELTTSCGGDGVEPRPAVVVAHAPGALDPALLLEPQQRRVADRLLTGLRGKDVLLLFVESYGRVAVQGTSFSPAVAHTRPRDEQLRAPGFAARSAFLTSPTFGGISWLAHVTLQSGIWADSRRRYDQLVKTHRFTLGQAFKRAGWRTVADLPENNRDWPEGSSYYHYDRVYDRRTLGYRGPMFGLPSMPDQFVFGALQRLELAKPTGRHCSPKSTSSRATPRGPASRS